MENYYNSNLVLLLRGYIGSGQTFGNDNIDALLKRINDIIIATEAFKFEFASIDYRDLMFLLEYIAKNNSDLRANIELRKELLLSYDKTINDWQIFSLDNTVSPEDLNYINELFEDIVYKVAEMPTNIISFGQSMLKVNIENGRIENQLPILVQGELLNQTSFQRDSEGYAQVYENNQQLEKVKIIGRDNIIPADKFAYVYAKDNEVFTGGVLKTLLLLSLIHLHNNNEWANFNTKLKGIIAGVYDLEKLTNSLGQLQQYHDSIFGKKPTSTDMIEQYNSMLANIMDDIRNAGKNRVTVVPNSVEVKQFDVVGTQGYGSFKEFDFLCKQQYENTYLGQASNSLVANAQSYSGSGIQSLQLNTQNKERTDRRIATKIMNQILSYYWSVWKGNTYLSPLRFKYGVESNEDAESNMKIFNDLSTMNMNVPYRILPEDFCKKIGLPFEPELWSGVPFVEIGQNAINSIATDIMNGGHNE